MLKLIIGKKDYTIYLAVFILSIHLNSDDISQNKYVTIRWL